MIYVILKHGKTRFVFQSALVWQEIATGENRMKIIRMIALISSLILLGTVTSCQNQTPSGNPADSYEKMSDEITNSMNPESNYETLTNEIATEQITEMITEVETVTDPTTRTRYEIVNNPIHNGGGDPWVVSWEGDYYYCYSIGNGVSIAKMPSLHKLQPKGMTVYSAPGGTTYSHEYWAPELHYIRGEWYIYVAADGGNNENHRMYVLKGTSQNPRSPFEMVGQITDPSNKWAIDGTVMEFNGELYFIWSGWEGDVNVAQNIYIAHMSDPCTIDSERVCISVPKFSWEKHGNPYVNEGPTVLQHDGKTFLIYSASGSWTDHYCLGILTLVGNDPMNPEHWEKEKQPVFKMNQGVCYGPGHSSFSTAIDGSVWMIYHGNLVSGSGWSGRSVWISPVNFDENGKPDFGKPEAEVRFPVEIKP